MMFFHTLACSLVVLFLLLAILRPRVDRLPAWIPAGTVLLGVAQIFPWAVVFMGPERISRVVEGRWFEQIEESRFYIEDGIEVSEDFFMVQSTFGALEQLGVLLIAIGFALLVRKLIVTHSNPVAR